MKKMKMGKREGEYIHATITLRKEHKEWAKRKGINLSRFVQNKLDEEMYLPFVVVKVASADNPEIPIMSVVLVPREKEGDIMIEKRGTYLMLDGGKYYIKPVSWEVVRKKKVVYVWED